MINLPLAQMDREDAPGWHGFKPALNVMEPPEPAMPQGAYAPASEEVHSLVPPDVTTTSRVELLAPAGGPDAGFAAFAYGADAIYLGLQKFSARAEAENFTIDEVDEITAYAHSLMPRRRVFVTINTLVLESELPELIHAIAQLADVGVDAIIIQDLGVYYLVRRYFPSLELHASTQLAVHNRAGAETLAQLGFKRVVLARELTFEEVRDVTATGGVETEVFIHGALCYAYSGLCLFSSQTLSRSGNRGKCAYSCRDSYEVTGAPMTLRDGMEVKRDPTTGFPFSMKDLALPDHLPALRAAGVSCFKIEGRKKSPLYVATTTDYYRKLLDGTLTEDERPEHEAELQTVFSRPWTRLFLDSHRDKEVADRDTVGHRGTLIGHVERVIGEGTRDRRLRFRTHRPIERHDGLQIDLPTLGKPFGFAVDRLWRVGRGNRREECFEVPGGVEVEIELPNDHPALEAGWPVYCSSSQAVKRKYRFNRPKPGLHHRRRLLDVEVRLTADSCHAIGRVDGMAGEASLPGPFANAKDPEVMQDAVHTAFNKLGDTQLQLHAITLSNPAGLFVPVSRLNQLRRDLVAQLEQKLSVLETDRVNALVKELTPLPTTPRRTTEFAWSLKIDRVAHVDAFAADDWHGMDELIIDVARDSLETLRERLAKLAPILGKDRIRLALPALTRKWEERNIEHKIAGLRADGWHRWEAANLSAWSFLHTPLTPRPKEYRGILLDLSTDWSVYVTNRLAALQLLDMSVTRFALSPEDGMANMRSLLAEFGARAVVIAHQDTPLFVAESCAYANLIGGCPGKGNCRFDSMEMVSSHGERVTALDYHCRTIVLNQGPYSLSTRLKDLANAGAISLRADFVYRPYAPEEVRDRWGLLRAGKPILGGHSANFDRGMM